ANTDEIAHLVHEGTLDCAINGGFITYPPYINVVPLMKDPLVLIASPHHPLAKLKVVTPEHLKNAPFIIHATNSQLFEVFKTTMDSMGLTSNIIMSLGNIDAIKQAVAADLGLAFSPYSAVALEIEMGLLTKLPLKAFHTAYPYSIIHHSHKFLSPATFKLLEMIKSDCQTDVCKNTAKK
ncbi:MAG: LysR substrate-binding domain-containing protein, partial [Niameybacter sp.]